MNTTRTSTATNPTKTATTKTAKLFIILTSIVLVIVIGVVSVMASVGYFGRATLFKGKVEILGVVAENPQIKFISEGETLGKYANFATEAPVDFPVLDEVEYSNGKWADVVSGRSPIYTGSFRIGAEYGSIDNLRCHLAISGNTQLAPTIRVGLIFEYADGEGILSVLKGFNDTTNTDISVYPYSTDIECISTDRTVKVTACIWVDKTALEDAGIYANKEMEVSLVIY